VLTSVQQDCLRILLGVSNAIEIQKSEYDRASKCSCVKESIRYKARSDAYEHAQVIIENALSDIRHLFRSEQPQEAVAEVTATHD
jgi:hypothetical protein